MKVFKLILALLNIGLGLIMYAGLYDHINQTCKSNQSSN